MRAARPREMAPVVFMFAVVDSEVCWMVRICWGEGMGIL